MILIHIQYIYYANNELKFKYVLYQSYKTAQITFDILKLDIISVKKLVFKEKLKNIYEKIH